MHRPSRRRVILAVPAAVLLVRDFGASVDAQLKLPVRTGSVRFAVIGDSGTGRPSQFQLGRLMARFHADSFPSPFVLMLGDNVYDGDEPIHYARKFERPYRSLLESGVRFYAVLGSHDDVNQRNYPPFNMNGRYYYSFTPPQGSIRFFALDSERMDTAQVRWVERELAAAREAWKICFFHTPIYSSGSRHGSDLTLRRTLEPIFIRHGVRVVFSGHDHFYERLKPQSGVYYFISGGAGRLREGNIRPDGFTAAGFDRDLHFMLVEIDEAELHFQVIARDGSTVDAGVIRRDP